MFWLSNKLCVRNASTFYHKKGIKRSTFYMRQDKTGSFKNILRLVLLQLLLTPRTTWRLLMLLLWDRVDGLELVADVLVGVDGVGDGAGVEMPVQVHSVCRRTL